MTEPTNDDERKQAEAWWTSVLTDPDPDRWKSMVTPDGYAHGLAAKRAETDGLKRGIAEVVMLLHSDDDPENRCMVAFDALGELLTGDPAVDATVRERDEARAECERLRERLAGAENYLRMMCEALPTNDSWREGVEVWLAAKPTGEAEKQKL